MGQRTLRPLQIFLLFVLSTIAVQAQSTSMNKATLDLNQGWEFRQVTPDPHGTDGQWHPAQVPGDVHLDLLRNKLIPDPFFRDNEAKLQWIEKADWEYRTTVNVPSTITEKRNVELVFDGLDAYCEVYVNGQKILTADNMFRTWRANVKQSLHAGSNEVRVVFPSPDRVAKEAAAKDPWQSRTKTEAKTYIRKAAYEYGWDWGPVFVTSGIWRPARVEAWDDARIDNVHVRQRGVTSASANLNVEVEVVASADASGKISVRYQHAGKSAETARQVQLHAGVNHVDLPVEIAKPDLWYPAGYGAQPVYEFTAQVTTSGSKPQDQRSVKTGLRSVVLRRDLDKYGRSFEFVINGIPVFAKGADVIPFDSFPNRVTTAQYRRILQSAKDANMNMIRHWGGGYYETDEFYEICDELGIMVWQDFMFGNDWQPGYYPWKLNVAQEVEDQVKRLRDHPSIVLWCGNNETEAAIGWHDRPKLPADVRYQMWQDYVSTFSGVIPQVVQRLDPERPYWPSSPSADYEETSDQYQSGDQHDWSVWHGRVPFSTYEEHHPRFVSEYGFQSFPEMQTIKTFTDPEDRTSIFTPVMLAHQKNNEGNSIIHNYLLKDYSEPKDFPSFLYVSQVLQAEGIKIGAEHFRRNRPETMGSLFWQLNDCWPVASWSSIDYYGRWKALQYYARRFYAPLLVSPHLEDGALKVYVVSDNTQAQAGEIHLRLLDFSGKVLKEATQKVTIAPLSSQTYLQWPLSDLLSVAGADPANVIATAELAVDGRTVSRNLAYLVPTKQVRLPQAKLATELTQSGGSYRLRVSSPVLARSVYVSFGDADVQLSDNYFDLLPGESVDVTVSTAPNLDTLKQQLKVMSLVDAFDPNATSKPALASTEP